MTRDELIETMARAICIESGYEPDSADHETLPDNESIDGWRNWFGFKSESLAVLSAIEDEGLAIVPALGFETDEMERAAEEVSPRAQDAWECWTHIFKAGKI